MILMVSSNTSNGIAILMRFWMTFSTTILILGDDRISKLSNVSSWYGFATLCTIDKGQGLVVAIEVKISTSLSSLLRKDSLQSLQMDFISLSALSSCFLMASCFSFSSKSSSSLLFSSSSPSFFSSSPSFFSSSAFGYSPSLLSSATGCASSATTAGCPSAGYSSAAGWTSAAG